MRLSAAVRSCVMRVLNVAEKNDAAKTIAAHLSKGTSRRREGLSTYNKIYEFETTLFGRKCAMIVTSVSGHLLNYEFVGSYKSWQSCDPLRLFEAPVAKTCPEDYQKIKLTLEREASKCQSLVIWTDCDREGENIGFEVIKVCTGVKSDLNVYRAKFSEITGAAVNRALQNLVTPDERVSEAVDVRQELDLRIGAAFTRFQTLRLQKVFPEKLANNLISYGSCQFPTLGFVVERYRAVENFVPENFWRIAVTHVLNDLKVEFSWKRGKLFDEQSCSVIHDTCMENPIAVVEAVKSKPKSKWRPLPLDTIEMEKLGSRKLKINAKETMKIAEKLYTQGIISYPRTETNIYPKELDLSNLINLQTENPEWGPFAQKILQDGGPTPRQGKKSDQAHPPIHPTKHVTNLTGNEKKVYELVVRSFLACCSKDALGHETITEISVGSEKFSANGLMIIERNYLDVYPYEKWSAKEIHQYEVNQTFSPTSIEMLSGQTTAPALLTEADLIALMEKHGIGTDATHADHIETIKSRSYVALADNIHFVPGLLGMGLVEGYDSMGLAFSKPNLRAGLEADLKQICEGRKMPQAVLSQQIATYRDVYITVAQEAQKLDQALGLRFNQQPLNESLGNNFHSTVIKCQKCGSDMTLRTKKDEQNFFVSCMGYPQCKNVVWLPSIISKVRVLDQHCEICGPRCKKLEFHWKNRSIEHLYPSPYISCIGGCDPRFLQTLNITTSNQNNVQQTPSTTAVYNSQSSVRNQSQSSSNRTVCSVTNNLPFNNNIDNSSRSNWFNSDRETNQSDRTAVSSKNKSNNTCSTVNTNNWNSHINNTVADNHVVCNCGEPAVLLTVKKATPNMGRQFYKCMKPRDNGDCNFFLWADSGMENKDIGRSNTNQTNQNENNSVVSSTTSHTNSNTSNNWDISNNIIPKCNCNLLSKKATVFKEGPTKGRQFFGCPKPISNRCNFFQWADDQSSSISTAASENQPSTSWGVTSNRGKKTRRNIDNNDGERPKKKCGICREEGHNRNKCPKK